MAWTTVTKPMTSGWTNTNPAGRTQYDQSDITYDSSTTFYDGVDTSLWTMVAKPSDGGSKTILVGMATGLLAPLTYSRQYNASGDRWIKVAKPSS